MRTTYFVEPHPDLFLHFEAKEDGNDGKVLIVDDSNAAKHLRDIQVVPSSFGTEGSETVVIQYYDGIGELDGSPFDPPVRDGLFVMASLTSDPENVVSAVKSTGFDFDLNRRHNVIETDDYSYWFVPLEDLRAPEITENALRLTWTPSKTIKDQWFAYRSWHEKSPASGEIGVFNIENKPNSLVMTGRVRGGAYHEKVGEIDGDSFGEPMILRWYPKHQTFVKEARASIAEPYGSHPKLKIDLEDTDQPDPSQNCRLYAQVDLPTHFFYDRYELEDSPQISPPAQALGVWGDNDLEKPEWSATSPISASFALGKEPKNFSLPSHFRYELPTDDEIVHGKTLSPFLFWACQNDDMPDRAPEFVEPYELLGIESVFPVENTQFYIVRSNRVPFHVPAISSSPQNKVEHITVVVISIGALVVSASVLVKSSRPSKATKRKQD